MMELLIVLVIVGILASLRFSDFGKLNEKNKGVEAEANLYLIYNAQKRYALEHEGVYTADISDLDITLPGNNFTYTISVSVTPQTAFTATATRRNPGGLCDGKMMTIEDKGGQVNKEECP